MELGEEDKGTTLTLRGERGELELQEATTVLRVEGVETRSSRSRSRGRGRKRSRSRSEGGGGGEGAQDVRIVIEMVRRVHEFESEGDLFESRREPALVVRDMDGEGEGSVQKRKLGNFGEF
jgi:hypothetical protein